MLELSKTRLISIVFVVILRLNGEKSVQKSTVQKYLIQTRSVTAEIFLIWTNVAMTNVARTNVTVIFRICFI